MYRKVFKTGNSLVVSLPKDLLESLGIKNGTEVSVVLDRKNRQILIRPIERPLEGDLSQEFARQVNEFIDQYRLALESLSKKWSILPPNKCFSFAPAWWLRSAGAIVRVIWVCSNRLSPAREPLSMARTSILIFSQKLQFF